jgi:transcriptional regulator with XRE-family HTH domain
MLEYDRKKLGDYLKTARSKVDLTQANVSERFGYSSPQYVSNIERGISVMPLKLLARMLKLYKVGHQEAMEIILESQRDLLRKKFTRSKTT